jgi:hypothetical protein
MPKHTSHVTPEQAALIEQAKDVLHHLDACRDALEKAKTLALEISRKLQDAFPLTEQVFAGKQSAVIDGLKLAYSRISDDVEPYAGENWQTIAERARLLKDNDGKEIALHVLRFQIDKPTMKVQPADLLKRLRVKRIEGEGYNFKCGLAE